MIQSVSGGGARRDLFLIIGMLVAVVATSTALYWAATSGRIDLPALLGTSNKGELIRPPRAFNELRLQRLNGEPFDFAKEKPHWTLLIPVSDSCDKDCADTLYLTRQIRTSLGKNMGRLQRHLVSKAGVPDAEFAKLLEDHPGVQVLLVDSAGYNHLFEGFEPVRERRYFVVDPQGWMMMAYGPRHDGKAVIADLKFLLTNSHEDEAGALSDDGKTGGEQP
jgi:hypothetical protein